MALRLGMTGDVMLGRLVDEAQRQRPASAVWGDVRERLRSLDGLLINLECCLSTRGSPWQRTNRPFHFRADPDWAIPALEDAGVDCCALANNHVLDFEEPALGDTLAHLDDAGIAHAGAGETEEEAFAPATFRLADAGDDAANVGSGDAGDAGSGEEDDAGSVEAADAGSGEAADGGLDVAVVPLTDNTPEYAATETSPGTAHVDIDVDDPATRAAVDEALDRASATDPDLLIASLHWGPNMVTEPPEAFQQFGRWLVERGVDLVHGHSAHVFQGIEVHEGAPICYDCGDFVDDYAVDQELRNDRGFLFEVHVERGPEDATGAGPGVDGDANVAELRLHPTEVDDFAVHRAGPTAAEWSRQRMRELSAPFGTTFERDGEALVVPVGA